MDIKQLKYLYYQEEKSMKEVALELGVSLDAVVYAMRKFKLKRRGFKEANFIQFKNKASSFKIRKLKTLKEQEIRLAGAMLYLAEGYKGSKTKPAKVVDLANSDPKIIKMFILFLRTVFQLDESRLRVQLYCHNKQKSQSLIQFWSKLTNIPPSQFSKPYIPKRKSKKGNGMQYGLVHIRYADKKLLFEILQIIMYYVSKCVGGGVVNRSAL